MRKTLLFLAVTALPASAMAAAGSYTVDPAHTFPHFEINHLGFSTMHGRFNATEGKLTVDLAGKTGSVDVKIDANSIDTGFKKRDDHLRSPDFLDTARFPELVFTSKAIERKGDGLRLIGDLTIRDVTREITLAVEPLGAAKDPWGNARVAFAATGSLDRKDFGLHWNQVLEAGGFLVGDRIELSFDIQAIAAAASAAA